MIRVAMTLLAVLTTTTAMADRQSPVYNIEVCKGGIGEVYVRGWVYDPNQRDQEIDLYITIATALDENDPGYDWFSTEDYPESITRKSRQVVNNVHNLTTGNHGFEARIPIEPLSNTFGEDVAKTFYVKIYARTYEYNPNNPNHDNYQYQLNGQYTAVNVVINSGYGTAADPFLIANATHWDAMADVLADADVASFYNSCHYKLDDNYNHYPEGYVSTTPVTKMWGSGYLDQHPCPFAGNFDGNGKRLYVNISNEGLTDDFMAAPFAYAQGASIHDLTVSGTVRGVPAAGGIVGIAHAGGIVGIAKGTLSMDRCVFDGTISNFYESAGGLICVCDVLTLQIQNCLFKGSFSPMSQVSDIMYHPITLKKDTVSVVNVLDGTGVYYLYTAPPTAELGDYIINGAEGTPVSTERVPYVWDTEVLAVADGNTYYAPYTIQILQNQPYTYGFEDDDNLAGGWRMSRDDGNPEFTMDTRHGGYYSLHLHQMFNTVISPRIDATGPIKFSFYYYVYGNNLTIPMRVRYSTTTADDFRSTAQTYCTQGSWEKYTMICPAGTKYVGIDVQARPFNMYIDDITIELSDITPTALNDIAATDVTATSANITWTGEAETFDVNFREKAFFHDDFSGGIGQWYAYEMTDQLFHQQPPTTWQVANPSGKNPIAVSINYYTWLDEDGNPTESTGVYDMDDWLISPKIPLKGTLYFSTKFDALSDDYDPETDKCEVLVTTSSSDYTTMRMQYRFSPDVFIKIDEIPTTASTLTNIDHRTCSLDRFNGQEGYIIFRHKSKHKSWFQIDDVYVYRTTNDFTTQTTPGHNLELTGLRPNTAYDFQVRSKLYSSVSSWSQLQSFTTEDFKSLADNAGIAALADGKKHDVILEDFKLIRDRNWSTLCLPFDVADGDDTDGITFSGTPLEGATVKELTGSGFSNDVLTMNFTEVSSIEAGKPYIVQLPKGADLVIHNDNEWGALVSRVAAGESFAGRYVTLDSDINVSTMVGTEQHPFCGTFDGNGHTLNVSIDNSGADYAAPFRYINGATICNVKVTGAVSGGQYCSGIVGAALGGTNNIRSCWMAATVTNQNYVGGVLGHGTTSSVTISGCYLTGNLSAQTIGVFCGGSSGGTNAISNCWTSGAYSNGTSITINLFLTDGGEVSLTKCSHNDDRITQGDQIGFMVGSGPIVSCLGDQWTSDDNINVVLKPSADLLSTDIQDPLFERVTVSSNAPTPANLSCGQFEGTYSPFADTSEMLLDTNNTANEAFHAAYGYDRTSLDEGFVNWYNDETLTSPATVIPFNADGNVTLYAGMRVELADSSDNSETIASAVSSGRTHDRTVVLKDRTLYRDDDWNTLCLPFSLNEAQIASSPLAGVTIMELDGTTSNLTNGTLTLNFKEAFSIEAGRPYLVKWQHPTIVIDNASKWESFASAVNNGTSYAGKLVRLAADIDVSTMAGTAEHPFCGIFDGNGHTLNLSIDETGVAYAAPFCYINGATICNLRVTGSVSGGPYCAGIVGAAVGGTNSIRNCWMAASVTSQGNNIGGILGHGTTSAVTISNCYLNGSLSGQAIGVFCGGGSDGGIFTAETCWTVGTYSYTFDSTGATINLNLVRTDGGTITVSNCHHNDSNIEQGDKYTLIGSGDERLANFLGNQWTIDENEHLKLKPSIEFDNTNIVSPVFKDVTIDASAPTPITFTGGQFVGTYNPVALPVDDKSNLFLGAANTLFYPNAANNADGKYYLNACRAYFKLTDPSATVKAFVLNFGDDETTDSLTPNPSPVREGSAGAWYDMSGRKVSLSHNTPSSGEGRGRLPRGIYIHNGKKIVIK